MYLLLTNQQQKLKFYNLKNSKMDELEKLFKHATKWIDDSIKNIDVKFNSKNCILTVKSACEDIGMFFIAKQDFESAKEYLYLYGIASLIRIKLFKMNEYSLKLISYSLLSDNHALMKEVIKADHQYNMTDRCGSIINCIQAAVIDDYNELKCQLKEMRGSILKKRGKKSFFCDKQFFQGLLSNDISMVEEAIIMLATKHHKVRNKHMGVYVSEIISIPALTYAKLAWMKGMEVDINHPLVPKELLPIRPNSDYWEYEFMKRTEFKIF